MSGLSISRAWDDSKEILARDGRLFVSVSLALITLPQTILSLIGMPVSEQSSPLSRAVYLLVVVIGFAAQIAINRLAMAPSVTVGGACSRGISRVWALLAVFLIFVFALLFVLIISAYILGAAGIVMSPGSGQAPPPSLILLMILMVVLGSAVFQLAIPIAAAERGGPIYILSRTWALARGNYLRLLGFVLLIVLGLILFAVLARFVLGTLILAALGSPNPGSLSALVLGLVLGLAQAAITVVSATMLARIYVQLAGRSEVEASVPKTGI